jgi:hypothetical protein
MAPEKLVGKPQEQGYDEHISKFSLSCETKVIKPVGERTTLPKVDAYFQRNCRECHLIETLNFLLT